VFSQIMLWQSRTASKRPLIAVKVMIVQARMAHNAMETGSVPPQRVRGGEGTIWMCPRPPCAAG
jgi:hypothetical protein